jgi:hypothetical protein
MVWKEWGFNLCLILLAATNALLFDGYRRTKSRETLCAAITTLLIAVLLLLVRHLPD